IPSRPEIPRVPPSTKLTSSLRLHRDLTRLRLLAQRQLDRQHAVAILRFHVRAVDRIGQRERTDKDAVDTFAAVITILADTVVLAVLATNRERVVLDGEVDVFTPQSRQLRLEDDLLGVGFVDVHRRHPGAAAGHIIAPIAEIAPHTVHPDLHRRVLGYPVPVPRLRTYSPSAIRFRRATFYIQLHAVSTPA